MPFAGGLTHQRTEVYTFKTWEQVMTWQTNLKKQSQKLAEM